MRPRKNVTTQVSSSPLGGLSHSCTMENNIKKYIGYQIWITVTIQTLSAPIYTAKIRRGILRGNELVLDWANSERNNSSVKIAQLKDNVWEGTYIEEQNGGKSETGYVKAKYYSSDEGFLLKGIYQGKSGEYVWIVELQKVDSFPDEQTKK